jgi:hypothetical protein
MLLRSSGMIRDEEAHWKMVERQAKKYGTQLWVIREHRGKPEDWTPLSDLIGHKRALEQS